MGYAYPIDSKVVTNPNGTIDYDRASNSSQLRGLIKSMITNGVNLTESTNLQVMADEETMNLVVKPGYVIIEGALKHFEDDVKVTISAADTTNPRIDTVVARLNLNEEVRDIVIDVLQGTPSETPVAPTLSQNTSTYYEVGLADILVEVGATQISQDVVTDTRLLNSRCGLATSIGEIDTETLFVQLTTDFDNWFESIKGKLGDDVAGGLQMQINGLADDIDTLEDKVETVEGKVEVLENTLGYTATKNLLENTGTSTTKNGITFTVNDDGSVTANGTATATATFNIATNLELPNGEYILSGTPADGGSDAYYMYLSGAGTGITGSDRGQGYTFVINDNIISSIKIYVTSEEPLNNVTFYPMIRKADVTDDTYEPYGKRDVDIRLNSVETNKADLDLSNVINSVFLSKAVNSGLGQVEVKSHVGTGTGSATSSNIKPVSITFSFAPKVVIYIGNQNSNGFYSTLGITGNNIMISSILTTEYKNFVGFKGGSTGTSNGKKSSDGKTFYWYTIDGSSSPSLQLNSSGFTYYFLAIG